MDTLRGPFDAPADTTGDDAPDDEIARDAPPAGIGTDERRMQVRAYNHWASLLGERNYPPIEHLAPDQLPDFGPYSVLLDFTNGIENPGIAYVGSELAGECGAPAEDMQSLADVPSRSLLTRITDHYMQILANQAPIGFEAEFVNQRGKSILYRGILLPFSTDDDTIDFIYGVINWKELADPQSADELLLEIDQALEPKPARAPLLELAEPLADWADGPGAVPANDLGYEAAGLEGEDDAELPRPSFGFDEAEPFELTEGAEEGYVPLDLEDETEEYLAALEDEDTADEDEADDASPYGSLLKTPIHFPATTGDDGDDTGSATAAPFVQKAPIQFSDADYELAAEAFEEPAFEEQAESAHAIVLSEIDPGDMGLGDWLAAAREMAAAARTSEDRTRNALYEAIGRAYDFSLAAAAEPQEFDELLSDSGLTVQDRAPMTPVVKLVFGADYDKTRLTEYAAALTHAHRLQLPQGSLGEFLAEAEGGLKGVVKAERRLRREELGKPVEAPDAPRHALARRLRALPAQDFADIAGEGQEFALVMIRRTEHGAVEMLGEVPDDVALIEKAARRLVG